MLVSHDLHDLINIEISASYNDKVISCFPPGTPLSLRKCASILLSTIQTLMMGEEYA